MEREMLYVKRKDWAKIATKYYGENGRGWKFKCVSCGHIQSGDSVVKHNPELKLEDVKNWIMHNCEGRHTAKYGCDWTLGGLLHVHKLMVIDDDKSKFAVFEFADEEAMKELQEKSVEVQEFSGDWHGSLWLVEKDMKVVKERQDGEKEKVVVKKASIVEFRYHHGVHFRTVDNQYLYANEGYFLDHCVYYGQILSDVRFNNRATTAEILKDELYELKLDDTNRCTTCNLKLPKNHPPTEADCKECRAKRI